MSLSKDICKSFQEFTFCGPVKENCVANQTLRDESCLVPCAGLYADVADDSARQTTKALEQNVIRGLQMLTQELDFFAWSQEGESKDRVLGAIQQMFTPEDKRVDDLKSLTEKYLGYKREYVKHLDFNPNEENLSKCSVREAPSNLTRGLFGHCQNGAGGLNACQDGLGHLF